MATYPNSIKLEVQVPYMADLGNMSKWEEYIQNYNSFVALCSNEGFSWIYKETVGTLDTMVLVPTVDPQKKHSVSIDLEMRQNRAVQLANMAAKLFA